MTDQLKTLMDRAADHDFAAVDLDAITGAGDRTVRRRRIAAGVAGVAALAVVGAGAVLIGDEGDRKTDFVDDPFRTDVPMWTEGSTLHTPDQSYELGTDVFSFVRTSVGIVYMGWESGDTFDVFSFTGEGEPTQIGETEDPHLVADPTRPYVGWVDMTDGANEAVILDLSSQELVWDEPADPAHSFPIFAIDGDQAYFAAVDEGPVVVRDLVSGAVTDLPGNSVYRDFVAASDGLVAHDVEGGLEVGLPGGDGVRIALEGADGAVFSPDGRWISVFSEQVAVYDTATGEPVAVDPGAYPNGLGYEWLDGDTLMAIAGSESGDEIALLTCEIPVGTCTEVAPLGGFESGEMFAIGFSEILWGLTPVEDSASSGPAVEMEASPANTERPE
jgi:hypothetical protein